MLDKGRKPPESVPEKPLQALCFHTDEGEIRHLLGMLSVFQLDCENDGGHVSMYGCKSVQKKRVPFRKIVITQNTSLYLLYLQDEKCFS
jgi:hypothetical protein